MNKPPGVDEMLALLERLRETVHEFAAREEKLGADFRARSAAESRSFEGATTAQSEHLARTIERAHAEFEESRKKWTARFEQRKSRISHGHMESRRRAMDSIREQEGRRKYKVQEGTLNAERRRDTALSATVAQREQFHADLAAANSALAELEEGAHRSLRGYPKLRRLLAPRDPSAEPMTSEDPDELLRQLRDVHEKASPQLARLRKSFITRTAAHLPLWISVLLLAVGGLCLLPAVHEALAIEFPWRTVGFVLVSAGLAVGVVRVSGMRRAQMLVPEIARDLDRARRLHDACHHQAEARFEQEQQRVRAEFEGTTRQLDQEWKRAVKEAIQMLDQRPQKIDEQAKRVTEKNERFRREQVARLDREHIQTIERVRSEGEAESRQVAETHAGRVAKIEADHQSRMDALRTEWRDRIIPILERAREANDVATALFPEWNLDLWTDWTPPKAFRNAARFGSIEVNLDEFIGTGPKDSRMALPGSGNLSLPLLLTYPDRGSVIFETSTAGADEAMAAINNIIFRLLSVTPPGKVTFTIFDPVGLGQNFAGLMHLADYEESHVNSRIWTQTGQLEEKLAELNEHMEKVIQMYLRNEYSTIAEYNAQAGSIAEKYHFLVIADFPVNVSDTAARRLINIAASGARCGVYTLLHWDQRQPLPPNFVAGELKRNSVCLTYAERGFILEGRQPRGGRLLLEAPPSPEFATGFLHKVGETGKDSSRVEVPFDQVAPPKRELWTGDTIEEVRVAIGRSGATKFQYLEIGKGTRQHALIAGKTGSGKSTLFHVIITNLALWCSPEQVEFYLVDFKKGVEFKGYATRRLPHARVVAIESDRQFGLSVLQRVDEELRRRGDLFRKLGVQDLPGYKRAGGSEPMPRSLLIIDEFQEFFTEEDRVSQGAAVLLDRIVRQGRAFGIHVLLGSQTLGGAYTLARATIGQMVIRIALQCNEADAYLIMDQDNPAPRLLSRPGEGIYNDAAGSIEGNSPFQAVWLPEEVRDRYLATVRDQADAGDKFYPGPFVFEGNAPADVRENLTLNALLRADAVEPPAQARIWLGAPNSVKGPTEAVFQRQSGSNLIIVGQSEEPAVALLSIALVALAAQYPKGAARFLLLDSTPPGVPQRGFMERVIGIVPHEIVQVKAGDLADTMAGLTEELRTQRADEGSIAGPDTFLLINGLQNYKRLRQEDEFGFASGAEGVSPAAAFLTVLSEGPPRGMHVLATCDTYNNANRFLGRKNLGEFEMRVLFQMSAADSASLIDDPAGSTLGLNRALYYNDREGYIETFRPYALPGGEWVDEVARNLARVHS